MLAEPSDWQLECTELKQRGAHLLQTGLWSDCSFLVGSDSHQVVLSGHKMILAMASPVFEAMFFGGMAERNEPIPILDVQPDAFRALLEYIYTDNINIGSFDKACELCYGAKKYMLPHLVKECTRYLWSDLYPRNACRAYEFARLFEENVLMEKCIQIISTNTKEVLMDSSFEEVELSTVVTVFSLDHLNVDSELDLFEAAVRYAKAQERRQAERSPTPSPSPKPTNAEKVVNVDSSAENSPAAAEEACRVPEPVAGPSTEPVAGPSTEPVAGPSTEPVAGPSTEPVAWPPTKSVVRSAVKSSVRPYFEPVAGPSSEPVEEPSNKPAVRPFFEPVAGPSSTPDLIHIRPVSYPYSVVERNITAPVKPEPSDREKLTIRKAVEQIRFLTLTPQQFAEGPARSALLTESEAFAVLLHILSGSATVPMPPGFSGSRVRRKQLIGCNRAREPRWAGGAGGAGERLQTQGLFALDAPPRPPPAHPRAPDGGRIPPALYSLPGAERHPADYNRIYCQRPIIQHTDCLNTGVLDCSVTFMVDKNICLLGVQVPTQAPSEEGAAPAGPGYSELLYAHLLDADGARLTYTHYTSRVPYRHLLDILFNRPVYIQRNKVYKVGIVFNKVGWYPMGSCAQQVAAESVFFNFGIGQSSDSVRDGLIRSIIFTY